MHSYNGWLKTFYILRFLNLKKAKFGKTQRNEPVCLSRMTTATNQLTAYDLFLKIDFIERKDVVFVLFWFLFGVYNK